MTEIDNESESSGKGTQPPLGFLKILCAISIIGGIMAAFSYLFIGVYGQMVKETALKTLNAEEQSLILKILATGRPYLFSSAALYLISAIGAYFMFYLHKKGFHIYAISQILLLIVPLVFIKGFPMSFLPVLFTASFILVYSSYLKTMR
jgi:hypothetical protein